MHCTHKKKPKKVGSMSLNFTHQEIPQVDLKDG